MRGALLLLAGCLAVAPALAQESGASDVERHVDALVARAAEVFATDPSLAWRRAYDLATLGPPAMPRLRVRAEGDDAVASLVALRALAELGEAGFAADRACDWAAAGPLATRVAAAEFVSALAARHQGAGGEPVRRALRGRLPALLDETFEPRVKVPLAIALWHAGADRRAVRELKSLLGSEDPEVVVQAALGLAEAGDVQAARAELEALRYEPTARGRLVRAVLERETLQRLLAAQTPGSRPLRIAGAGLELLDELRVKIEAYYPEDRDVKGIILAAARGIAASLDPATEFLEDAGLLADDGLGGVGFGLALKDGLPVVIGLQADGPAARLGIRDGDRVLRIAGATVFGEPLATLRRRLRGPVGEQVLIETWRDQQPRWVRWHKHRIPFAADVAPRVLVERLPGDLGYVRVQGLTAGTGLEVRDGLAGLADPPLQGLIVDLRGCATGSPESLLAVAAELCGPGRLIFSSAGRHQQLAPPRDHRTPGDPKAPAPPLPPLAVCVGPGTAGPGELLAAALQHHRAAELIGAVTFGNGQEVYTFPLATAQGEAWFRLPIAVNRTAAGATFHGTGLTPDVVVPPAADAGWIETERDAVRVGGQAVREAARLVQEVDPAAARTLGESDGGDWHAYPGFADWYATLGSRADPAHVRPLLRQALRAALAARGDAARVDPREDGALGRAVLRLLARAGADPSAWPLYAGLSGE